jgi:alkyl sulfatase BDS1-like metallo-beta-lactamase superfamily hydrolase
MAAFLSDEWIAALDAAALRRLPRPDRAVVIDQRVTGEPGARFHLRLAPDGCRVLPGAASRADLTLTVDSATAARLARGEESAQRALAEGRLKIGGHLDRIAELASYLDGLGDVYADVRAATSFPGIGP